MPEIEFAFLADAADVKPGDKFSVLGGGITRIGGPGFPLRHPHLALVVSVTITAVEFDREHEIDFRHATALECADMLITFRYVIRSVAARLGLHATFNAVLLVLAELAASGG